MSVTHVAGPVVTLSGRLIQRCVVCGEKLCDSLRVMMPLRPNGEPDEFATWKERHFVHIDGNRSSAGADLADPGPLPDDFCLALVE